MTVGVRGATERARRQAGNAWPGFGSALRTRCGAGNGTDRLCGNLRTCGTRTWSHRQPEYLPDILRVAAETRPKLSGGVRPSGDRTASPAPFLTGELRRAIVNGSHLARKDLGWGPGSCCGALNLVPDCLDARVTGHQQAHLGNSAADGGSCTGDGALKPSPNTRSSHRVPPVRAHHPQQPRP